MTNITELSDQISAVAESRKRIIVAISGSPASGKSTLVEQLQASLKHSVIVPMDGFHLDNTVLLSKGLMSRKGSPQSFDSEGYFQLLHRLKHSQETVYAPMFDRKADLSRAGAIEIGRDIKVILTEGNYLLLQQSPWDKLAELFDLSISLQVPQTTLKDRLIQRWLAHGLTKSAAIQRAESNDLLNSVLVEKHSKKADVVMNI